MAIFRDKPRVEIIVHKEGFEEFIDDINKAVERLEHAKKELVQARLELSKATSELRRVKSAPMNRN